jgi:hypothetical protein
LKINEQRFWNSLSYAIFFYHRPLPSVSLSKTSLFLPHFGLESSPLLNPTWNEPQVLVFIYIPPRFGLGDVIQRSIFNFTFSFSYKKKRKKIKIKFEPLKKLCFINKCYGFKISRWLLIMALVAIGFHPSSILASIYVLGY